MLKCGIGPLNDTEGNFLMEDKRATNVFVFLIDIALITTNNISDDGISSDSDSSNEKVDTDRYSTRIIRKIKVANIVIVMMLKIT